MTRSAWSWTRARPRVRSGVRPYSFFKRPNCSRVILAADQFRNSERKRAERCQGALHRSRLPNKTKLTGPPPTTLARKKARTGGSG